MEDRWDNLIVGKTFHCHFISVILIKDDLSVKTDLNSGIPHLYEFEGVAVTVAVSLK